MQRIKTWIRENPHVWWALVLPVYLTLFFIIEHFIKDNYWATQTSIDYHIPFIPQFIVIYDSWSFLLFALGIYLIVKDPEGFRRYMWTILLTFFHRDGLLRPRPERTGSAPRRDGAAQLLYLDGAVYLLTRHEHERLP